MFHVFFFFLVLYDACAATHGLCRSYSPGAMPDERLRRHIFLMTELARNVEGGGGNAPTMMLHTSMAQTFFDGGVFVVR